MSVGNSPLLFVCCRFLRREHASAGRNRLAQHLPGPTRSFIIRSHLTEYGTVKFTSLQPRPLFMTAKRAFIHSRTLRAAGIHFTEVISKAPRVRTVPVTTFSCSATL